MSCQIFCRTSIQLVSAPDFENDVCLCDDANCQKSINSGCLLTGERENVLSLGLENLSTGTQEAQYWLLGFSSQF